MSAEPVDQTRLTAVPSQPDVDDAAGNRMNGFEVVVGFIVDELAWWLYVALAVVTTTAGTVEMFMELGPVWSVLVAAGLIGAGIYGGSRLRLLPVVPKK